MFELEPLLKDFEALCGCKLTLHDQTHVLLNNDHTSMFRSIRSSHRQTYPECSRPCRQYCVTHCMNEYNDMVDRTRPRYCINHCREGHIEVAQGSYDGILQLAHQLEGKHAEALSGQDPSVDTFAR